MESDFYTAFDIAQTGYRDWPDTVVAVVLFLGCAAAIYFWGRNDRDARALKIILWSIFAVILSFVGLIQGAAFLQYVELKKNALHDSETTTGHIAYLKQRLGEGEFGVNGREFFFSDKRKPLRYGYQQNDFQLQPTYLVRVTSVDGVIVKLEVHNVHF